MPTDECILNNTTVAQIRDVVEAWIALLQEREPSVPLMKTIIAEVTSELWEQ